MIGSLLILFASTAAGLLLARRFRDRPREIRQWRSALQSIEAEIIYGRVPVDQLAEDLSRQMPEPLNVFFTLLRDQLRIKRLPLQEAWINSVEQFWPSTSMKVPEKEIILQFGTTLGTEDADNQKKHIQLALAHLEREESNARQSQQSNEKMMRSLGFLTGILVILLFI
ncbi:stage III sporulation protein SpoIIIAB [Sporolactobacillus shoreicorticis]|uniref:Stage III sporulation protein SpoIIIAB n=1 Tax=Sporolactobacillus shoreicorticis TaxID=1923877 RepID=A0ABW5S876_9BACL|nr:stage III sporulation protein SpoIIIAB [Sporolactobacillus shoreicorticis]MCO7126580.1 stage III sporulation protein SpoIIIAB [Sporolactobacillus shoreicorticis]